MAELAVKINKNDPVVSLISETDQIGNLWFQIVTLFFLGIQIFIGKVRSNLHVQ